MILANWVSITLGIIFVTALLLLLGFPKSKVYERMHKRSWSKVYGQEAIQLSRMLDTRVSEQEREEARRAQADLATSFGWIMSDEERNKLRETADAVISGCGQVEDYELTWLTARIGLLYSFFQSEEETTEKDAERFRKLCAIYDDMQKRKTKLKIKCPGCGRSVKGITHAMVGDSVACPKCRTEFVIDVPDQEPEM